MEQAQIKRPPVDPSVAAYLLRANGEILPDNIEVLGLEILRKANRIPTARLVIADGSPASQDFEVSNQPWFVPGVELEIFLGELTDVALLFKGIVVKQYLSISRGSSDLTIECKDAAYRMTLRRNSRYFEYITDQELAESLIKENGLEAKVDEIQYQHQELVQYDVTDWDFLMMRMEFNGFVTFVENGKLRIEPPNFEQEPALLLEYGTNIFEFEGALELRDQFKKVMTRSWNPLTQEVMELSAQEPPIEPNGDINGSDLADANGLAPIRHRHGGHITDIEMQTWANARLLKDRLARTRGRVKIQGYKDLLPGQIVQLSGFGNRFNGPVYVAGIRQEFQDNLWLTDIEFGLCPKWFAQDYKVAAPPAAGMLAPVSGLQIGIVTQVEDDPDGQHRIQVRLPIIDKEAPGIWARVASLDAGPNRGTFFRPEVNDEVIVGFINDDPRDAIILGMLHSSTIAPPFLSTKENHEKGYVSRQGLRFTFHEEDKSIVFETPGKNQFILSDQNQGLLLKDQHGNSIELGKDGITINSIKDLKINVENDAQTEVGKNWQTKAKKQIALKASKTTEIKGNPVNIN